MIAIRNGATMPASPRKARPQSIRLAMARPIAPPQPAGRPFTAPPANRPAAAPIRAMPIAVTTIARSQRPGSLPRGEAQADDQDERQQQRSGRPHHAQQQVRGPCAGAAHPIADRAARGGVERRVARPVADQGDEREQRQQADREPAEQAARAPREALRTLAPLFQASRPAVVRGCRRHLLCPKCSHALHAPSRTPGSSAWRCSAATLGVRNGARGRHHPRRRPGRAHPRAGARPARPRHHRRRSGRSGEAGRARL